MTQPLTTRTKLTILVSLAVCFGASVVALSINEKRTPSTEEAYDRGSANVIDQQFTVHPGDKLVLEAHVGDIRVEGIEGDQVIVHIVQKGDEDLVKGNRISLEQEGNIVEIKSRHDRHLFRIWDDVDLRVQYEIQVPKSFNLDMETSGGNIEIYAVAGEVRGSTSGGDVDIANLKGVVNVATSGGNVTVKSSEGDLTLETSGGDILGETVTGNIHVETSGGNITFRDTDGKLYASTSGGNIRAQLKDNKGIDLSTSGGNIEVSLPPNVAGDLEAESTGGDVSCEFAFAGKAKDESLHGKINGGGNLIRLESCGGGIVINSVE